MSETPQGEAPLAAAPTPTSAGPSGVRRDASSGEVAFAVMRAQRDALRSQLATVADADDPEARHRVRVAIRRLRAALALFAEALPSRAHRHRERLDRLGGVLGPARDLDVLKARLAEWSARLDPGEAEAAETIGRVIEERRVHARARATAEFGRTRTARTLAMLDGFLARGPVKRSRRAGAPVVDLASELLERAMGKLVAAGDLAVGSDDPAVLHALRIRSKRLRYLIEFLEPVYGKSARRYLKRLIALQDLLGEHQDQIAAIATLRGIALDSRRRRPARTVLVIGVLIERCEASARESRTLLPDRYRKVTGRRWRKLVEAAENARERPRDAHQASL